MYKYSVQVIMQEIDQPGLFYLGKIVNPENGKLEKDLLLYESKNFTTHAVCVGMTGSGKTGLGISILEEGGLKKIPALIIDPKGDLSNLFLTFPQLSPEEFRPWIDDSDAERKGMDADQYAKSVSETWKEGLAKWGEDGQRIQRLRDAVELAIYTPASNAGQPLSILNSFAAPPQNQIDDEEVFRDKVLSTTSSLLSLLGIDADPVKSREHILIANLIQQSWQNGKDLAISSLIQQVQKPPFTKIGALDIDTFYPPKERLSLSIALNNFLASPSFKAWMEGDPLDIDRILQSSSGKPKLSIISLSHLSDAEKMFFVTLLLNTYLTWMRGQPGTSNLKTILYMDEIFGFFPPSAMPPSKLPMITLLKQARAYGTGIILVTQNPVDLDYKGLSNCGTWFIGKLQTARDKARVLEGLKTASNGEINTAELDKMVALIGNRTFIMRSIYKAEPILFQTRWTLSYLRGPLTLAQISLLSQKSKKIKQSEELRSIENGQNEKSEIKPAPPASVSEFFVDNGSQKPLHYEPRIAGIAKLHYVDSKKKIDLWEDVNIVVPSTKEGEVVNWEEGENIPDLKTLLKKESIPGSTFSELPAGWMQEKNYQKFSKEYAAALYQNQTYQLYQTTNPSLISAPKEDEKEFKLRVLEQIKEGLNESEKKVREKYAAKIDSLSDKIRRCEEKIAKTKEKKGFQIVETIISFISTIISALFGKKITKGTITQTGTSLRRATRLGKDSSETVRLEEELDGYQRQLEEEKDSRERELKTLDQQLNPENIVVETLLLRPRKSDISVEKIALVWWAEIRDMP